MYFAGRAVALVPGSAVLNSGHITCPEGLGKPLALRAVQCLCCCWWPSCPAKCDQGPEACWFELLSDHFYLFLCRFMPLYRERMGFPLLPPPAFPGICLCLDLINMKCAEVFPMRDTQVCECARTHAHTHRACCLATGNFPLLFYWQSLPQPNEKVTAESGWVQCRARALLQGQQWWLGLWRGDWGMERDAFLLGCWIWLKPFCLVFIAQI